MIFISGKKCWYIASRTKHIDFLNETFDRLESGGQEVALRWSSFGNLKPYSEHRERCTGMASQVVDAIKRSDVFVMLSDEGGTDIFLELGVAISAGVPAIYVVGEHNKRSVMLHHPVVRHADTFDDVLEKEAPALTK